MLPLWINQMIKMTFPDLEVAGIPHCDQLDIIAFFQIVEFSV